MHAHNPYKGLHMFIYVFTLHSDQVCDGNRDCADGADESEAEDGPCHMTKCNFIMLIYAYICLYMPMLSKVIKYATATATAQTAPTRAKPRTDRVT